MPIRVMVPDRGIVEFPDGTDEATMRAAIDKIGQSDQPSDLSRFASGMWRNLNPMGLVQAVRHPIDTATAMIQAQGDQFSKAKEDYQQGRYSEMAGHAAAGLLPIMGPVAAHAGETIGTGDVATGAGEATGLLAPFGIKPLMSAAPTSVTQALPNAVRQGSEAVYRGYLKPSLAKASIGKADQIVKTAIDEAIPVSKEGAMQAQSLIGELRGKVDTLLTEATGQTVDLHQIADEVRAFAKRMYNRPGRSPSDYQAALDVADRIDKHPSMSESLGVAPERSTPPSSPTARDILGPPNGDLSELSPRGPMPVDLHAANQVKRDLQQSVSDSQYGVKSNAATTTEKHAARVTREAIEQQVPSISSLNAREGRLIEVAKSVNRALGREGNTSALYGVRSLLAPAIGGSVLGTASGNPYAAAVGALATKWALQPSVATKAAILATKMADRIPGAAVADIARVAIAVSADENNQESASH